MVDLPLPHVQYRVHHGSIFHVTAENQVSRVWNLFGSNYIFLGNLLKSTGKGQSVSRYESIFEILAPSSWNQDASTSFLIEGVRWCTVSASMRLNPSPNMEGPEGSERGKVVALFPF